MNYKTHQTVTSFLDVAQGALAKNESANNLMLGITERLKKNLDSYASTPYFGTVADENGLVMAAIMTPPYNLVIHCEAQNCSPAFELVIESLLKQQWNVPGVSGRVRHARQFAEKWTRQTGEESKIWMNQRIFELRACNPPSAVSGRMRVATEDDIELITKWTFSFHDEALGGSETEMVDRIVNSKIRDREIYFWEDGQPVSLAAKVRPCGAGVSVSLVYTPPEHRRNGYASAVIAGLSQHLLNSGFEYCTLFTDLANPTSNKIYMRIGYKPVCDFDLVHFTKTG
ncbi:MAG: GNAT family N-acetyltransferase [Anaerolineaceae bacterium]|nr:GNAT family N-acetyltransferase [Anaerolineaceae bacterium]